MSHAWLLSRETEKATKRRRNSLRGQVCSSGAHTAGTLPSLPAPTGACAMRPGRAAAPCPPVMCTLLAARRRAETSRQAPVCVAQNQASVRIWSACSACIPCAPGTAAGRCEGEEHSEQAACFLQEVGVRRPRRQTPGSAARRPAAAMPARPKRQLVQVCPRPLKRLGLSKFTRGALLAFAALARALESLPAQPGANHTRMGPLERAWPHARPAATQPYRTLHRTPHTARAQARQSRHP